MNSAVFGVIFLTKVEFSVCSVLRPGYKKKNKYDNIPNICKRTIILAPCNLFTLTHIDIDLDILMYFLLYRLDLFEIIRQSVLLLQNRVESILNGPKFIFHKITADLVKEFTNE